MTTLTEGPVDTIHTHILRRQLEALDDAERDSTFRPNLGGLIDLLGGEIGFGEDLEGVAAFLPRGQVNDALLKLGEARQPRVEAGCTEMIGAAVTCA